ncbi:hypothetical protein [Streptomyces apocyni]|uniref:hypothetical protein n=1 Tax=Streptomyces apocyni TaxID=2654677 RepID=UPI0012E9FFA6|nr:hypothetical protein [Streptomyces apocyni]
MLTKHKEPASVWYDAPGGDPVSWKAGDTKDDKDDASEASKALPMGEPAKAIGTDRSSCSIPIPVTPKSVRAGSLADLSKFDLTNDQKKAVPHYVTFEYRNDGENDLYPGMQDTVKLQTTNGLTVGGAPAIEIGGPGVKQCPHSVPNDFVKPNATVTQCSIHFLPKDDRPATISFLGGGHAQEDIVWKAPTGGREAQ